MKSKWKIPKLIKKSSIGVDYPRSAIITPDLVGQSLKVHNGNSFIAVNLSSEHIGHKLGEFALTKFSSVYKKSKKKGR